MEPNLDVTVKSINGGPDPRFNQSLDWFVNSNFYTSGVPLNFVFANEANQLESGDMPWLKRRGLSFSRGCYTPGDKIILYYANEPVLNFGNSYSKIAILAEGYFIGDLLNEYNIPKKDIVLIGNLYQHHQCFSRVAERLKLSEDQVVMIDYYELQTFFFHRVLGCNHNKSFNPAAHKDLRYQYGKTSKLNRIIAMHELWEQGLLERSVTGCLIDESDIDTLAEETATEYRNWFKREVSVKSIATMMRDHRGSVDGAKYFYFKRQNPINQGKVEFINHCPGYPYDHRKIFSDAKVSLIPETFFYNNQEAFITEKTFKTIYNHHPFTILGTPGLLSVLRSRGYQTFGNVCNEMYDVCGNDRKRLGMVIESTKELINSTDYSEMKRVTEHNFVQLEHNALETVRSLNDKISKAFN